MNTIKKQKGFTLIELIAVIAILAILSAILVPNIIAYTIKAKLGKAAADAGIIVRAIDSYEAENSQADQTTLVVTKSGLSTDSNNEDTLKLNELVARDTTFIIVGVNGPIGAIPNEYTKNGKGSTSIAPITIKDLRTIAAKQVPITIDRSNGDRVDTVDGGSSLTYP